MKNRYFQFLRGILIFVVILIHTIYLNNEKYINCINIGIRCLINFCVPLFIFISGYFVNKSKVKDNPRKYIKSRFYKIVIPLVCFSFVYTMIDYFTKGTNIDKSLIKFITFKSEAHLYYIVALFQLVLLTPVLLRWLERKEKRIVIYLITPIYLLIIFIVRIIFEKEIPFSQYFFFGWIIYYILGLESEKIKLTKNYFGPIFFILISLFVNISLYCINEKLYTYSCSQLNIVNMFYVISILPIVLINNNKYKSSKFENIIEKIGDNSFGIYLVHLIFLKICAIAIKKLNLNVLIYYVVLTFCTLIVSYSFIYLFKKITRNKFNKYLGF